MSEIRNAIDNYLGLRRALGYKLQRHAGLLEHFVSFMETQGAASITTELALRWATQPVGVQPGQWAQRLTVVRGFAQFHSASDPATEIPGLGLIRDKYERKHPYLYTPAEVQALLKAAGEIKSTMGLRARTCVTVLGLLVVTGMRVGELLGLDQDDVDLSGAVITIRESKFGKSRLVPLHPSTRIALADYAAFRNQALRHPRTTRFFRGEDGGTLSKWALRAMFIRISCQIGIRKPTDHRGPRLHDFRHRFAVNTLLTWYRAGVDVEQKLPVLSTYLGHVHVTDTYWYLSAVPELMCLVVEKLEADQGGTGE
jgi:integrase